MPTEHIKYEDTLRQGTDKINNAIDQANKAEEDSAEALDTANQALQNSESTQTQLDMIVIEGDSSVEAAQARVDADGNAYTTLKERLDTEHTEVTAQLAEKPTIIKSDETYTVGSTGDFQTINEALDYLSEKYPKNNSTQPFQVEIKLLSGFEVREQIFVKGIDLGWIVITSEDSEVPIIRSEMNEPTLAPPNRPQRFPAFLVEYGTLPIIGCLFNMDNSGEATNRDGIVAHHSSKAYILRGCGVKNAGSRGIYSRRGSSIIAVGAVASGAGEYGFHARHSALMDCREGDATNCLGDGISAWDACLIDAERANVSGCNGYGVHAYRSSVINAREITATDCGGAGVRAEDASMINAKNVDVSGANGHGIYALYGSKINADGATANDVGMNGVFAFRGSTINANGLKALSAGGSGARAEEASTINLRNGDVTNSSGHGIYATQGSIINADGATADEAGINAVYAHKGSTINFENGTGMNADDTGLYATRVSDINANGANVSGASNRGIYSQKGSRVNIDTGNAQKGASTSSSDMVVANGSTINAYDATGGKSQDFNVLTADGIIYQ